MKDLLIVIVDDLDYMRQCNTDLCEDLFPHADIVSFASAEEALIRYQSCVDLYRRIVVVTDYNMPGMLGTDLVLQLRAQGYAVPVIMISAESKVRDDAATLGVPFLEKPFGDEDFQNAMYAALQKD